MNVVGQHSRKELLVTLSIWLVLLVCAVAGLLILRANAVRIIDHINYVNVSRGAKAEVLYAEAEKNARIVLKKAAQLNLDSERKLSVPATDERLQKTIALFDGAFKADIRPEFAPERTMYYELLGQVHDAAGNRTEELLSHARAFISQEDTTDALEYIQQARSTSAASPEPLLLLVQLRDKNGQTSEALAVMDDLYSSYTITARARWIKADLLLRSGSPDKAIAELEKAVSAEETNLTYRRDLGVALANASRVKQAAEIMEAGLSDGGWLDAAYLHVYGGYLTDTGDIVEAIRVLQQADELAPNSGDVQWSLAQAYHLAGKTRQADSALRRAAQVKPELLDKVF